MKEKSRLSESGEVSGAGKREYAKPEMFECGHLHELTQGGSKGPDGSKGYGNNSYGMWS